MSLFLRTAFCSLLGLSFLVVSCGDDFGSRCTLPTKVQEACQTQGGGGSGLRSRINCVMEENLDCSSRICVVFQDGEPFCSKACTVDRDCPGNAKCVPLSIYPDSELYCVPTRQLEEDEEAEE